MRVLLDTNIVLDVLLNRSHLVADSAAVIQRCEAVGAEMFIAWHGIATAYYLLKRGRTEEEALGEVDKILAWARVASGSDLGARQARLLGFGDFEDALQAVCAEECGAEWFVTRNAGDFPGALSPPWIQKHFSRRWQFREICIESAATIGGQTKNQNPEKPAFSPRRNPLQDLIRKRIKPVHPAGSPLTDEPSAPSRPAPRAQL
jgi:predicted nucleic acid-binding protein